MEGYLRRLHAASQFYSATGGKAPGLGFFNETGDLADEAVRFAVDEKGKPVHVDYGTAQYNPEYLKDAAGVAQVTNVSSFVPPETGKEQGYWDMAKNAAGAALDALGGSDNPDDYGIDEEGGSDIIEFKGDVPGANKLIAGAAGLALTPLIGAATGIGTAAAFYGEMGLGAAGWAINGGLKDAIHRMSNAAEIEHSRFFEIFFNMNADEAHKKEASRLAGILKFDEANFINDRDLYTQAAKSAEMLEKMRQLAEFKDADGNFSWAKVVEKCPWIKAVYEERGAGAAAFALSKNPEIKKIADVADGEWEKFTKSISAGWRRGSLQDERGNIGRAAMASARDLTDDERKRIGEIDAELEKLPAYSWSGFGGWLGGFAGSAAENAKMMTKSQGLGFAAWVITAAAMKKAGASAETIAKYSKLAYNVASVGMMTGDIGGLQYLDLIEKRDENGKRIYTNAQAATLAAAQGIAEGILEQWSINTMGRAILGKKTLKDIASIITASETEDAAKRGVGAVIRERLGEAAKAGLISVASEDFEEFTQQAADMAIENIWQAAIYGKKGDYSNLDDILASSTAQAIEAVPACIGFGIGGFGGNIVANSYGGLKLRAKVGSYLDNRYARAATDSSHLGGVITAAQNNIDAIKELQGQSPEVVNTILDSLNEKQGIAESKVDINRLAKEEGGEEIVSAIAEAGGFSEEEIKACQDGTGELVVKTSTLMQIKSFDAAAQEKLKRHVAKGGSLTLQQIEEARKAFRAWEELKGSTSDDFEANLDKIVVERFGDMDEGQQEIARIALAENYDDPAAGARRLMADAESRLYNDEDYGIGGLIEELKKGYGHGTSVVYDGEDMLRSEAQYRVSENAPWYQKWAKEHGYRAITKADLEDIAIGIATGEAIPEGFEAYDIGRMAQSEEDFAEVQRHYQEAKSFIDSAFKEREDLREVAERLKGVEKGELALTANLTDDGRKIFNTVVEELRKGNKAVAKAAMANALLFSRLAERIIKEHHEAGDTAYTVDDFMKSYAIDADAIYSEGGSTETLHQLAGEAARNADLKKLDQAKQMEESGSEAEDIYRETGWLKGDDGRWRFYIPDNLGAIDTGRIEEMAADGSAAFLNEIYKNPVLYRAYPFLKHTVIEAISDTDTNEGGETDAENNRIKLNVGIMKGDRLKRAVVHEVQHLIQSAEGFARGGSPQEFIEQGDDEATALENYRNLAGEIEARTAEQAAIYEQNARETRSRKTKEYWRGSVEAEILRRNPDAIIVYGGEMAQSIAIGQLAVDAPPNAYVKQEYRRKPDSETAKVFAIKKEHIPQINNRGMLKQWVLGLLSGKTITINSTGEKVRFSKKGVLASVQKRLNAAGHTEAFAQLDKMIEAAEYSHTEPADARHEGKVKEQDVYHSALSVDGKLYSVRIKLDVPLDVEAEQRKELGETDIEDARYKDHKTVEIEITPALLHDLQTDDSLRVAGSSVVSDISLGVLRGNVKPSRINGSALFQRAWHGSPHVFENFDLGAIGTGEGAQVHGWGLYFGKDRNIIAERYRDRLVTLTNPTADNTIVKYRGRTLDGNSEEDRIIINHVLDAIAYSRSDARKESIENQFAKRAKSIRENNEFSLSIIKILNGQIDRIKNNPNLSISDFLNGISDGEKDVFHFNGLVRQAKYHAEQEEKKFDIKAVLEELQGRVATVAESAEKETREADILESVDTSQLSFERDNGSLFEVEIPDDDVLLDEQKTFGNQPDAVKKALSQSGIDADGITGREIYRKLAERLGGDRAASEWLNAHGVKGITYEGGIDGRCYVVFDDAAIGIIERYNKEANGIAQGATSPLSDGRRLIELFSSADESTFMHEAAHFYLMELAEIAKISPDSQAAKDLAAVLGWANWQEGQADEYKGTASAKEFLDRDAEIRQAMKDGFVWREITAEDGSKAKIKVSLESLQREWAQERFARAFEEYLRSGEAPAAKVGGKSLRNMFRRFKSWLCKIYRDFVGAGVAPSEEVKKVMAKMVSTDEEIEMAAALDMTKFMESLDPDIMNGDMDELYAKWKEEAKEEAKERMLKRLIQSGEARQKAIAKLRDEADEAARAEIEEMTCFVAEKLAQETGDENAVLSLGYASVEDWKADLAENGGSFEAAYREKSAEYREFYPDDYEATDEEISEAATEALANEKAAELAALEEQLFEARVRKYDRATGKLAEKFRQIDDVFTQLQRGNYGIPSERVTEFDADMTTEKANEALQELAGRDLHNDIENEDAQVNRRQRSKIISNRATAKSEDNGFERGGHLSVAAKMEVVWKNAALAMEYHGEGDNPSTMMRRYVSPIRHGNKRAFAWLTVKRSTEGLRIYTAELMDEKKLRGILDAYSKEHSAPARSFEDIISALGGNVNKADALKGLLTQLKYARRWTPDELRLIGEITASVDEAAASLRDERLVQDFIRGMGEEQREKELEAGFKERLREADQRHSAEKAAMREKLESDFGARLDTHMAEQAADFQQRLDATAEKHRAEKARIREKARERAEAAFDRAEEKYRELKRRTLRNQSWLREVRDAAKGRAADYQELAAISLSYTPLREAAKPFRWIRDARKYEAISLQELARASRANLQGKSDEAEAHAKNAKDAKQLQAYHTAMASEARKIQKDMEKTVGHIKRQQKKIRVPRNKPKPAVVRPEHRYFYDLLMYRYGLKDTRPMRPAVLDGMRFKDFLHLVELEHLRMEDLEDRAEDAGEYRAALPSVAPWIADALMSENGEKQSYRNLTPGELAELREAGDFLVAAGTALDRRYTDGESLSDIGERVLKASMENVGRVWAGGEVAGLDKTQKIVRTLKGVFGSWLSTCVSPKLFLELTDGGAVLKKYVYDTLEQARNNEMDAAEKEAAFLKGFVQNIYGGDAWDAWRRGRLWQEEIKDAELAEIFGRNREKVLPTKDAVLALALNYGNATNIERVVYNMRISPDELNRIFEKYMTEKDWQFVQGIWNHLNDLGDEVSKAHEKERGVPMRRVEAQPFSVRVNVGTAGEKTLQLDGGYYPICYDPKASATASANEQDELARAQSPRGAVNTGQGQTFARSKHVEGRPLLLSLSVLQKHINQSLHIANMHSACLDAMRTLKQEQTAKAIQDVWGIGVYNKLLDWVADTWDTSRGGIDFPKADKLRSNTVAAIMGYRIMTGVKNIENVTNMADRIGVINTLEAYARFFKEPKKTRRKVLDASVFMRNRAMNLERDLQKADENVFHPDNPAWHGLKKYANWFIEETDMLTTVPLFSYVYDTTAEKLAQENPGWSPERIHDAARREAETAVKNVAGSADTIDAAEIQRKKGIVYRMLTPFYTYFNVQANAVWGKLAEGYMRGRHTVDEYGRVVTDAEYKEGFISRYGGFMRAFTLRYLAAAIVDAAIMTAAAALMKGRDDKDEDWWRFFIQEAGKSAISNSFSGVPIIREAADYYLAGGWEGFVSGKQSGTRSPSLTGVLGGSWDRLEKAGKATYAYLDGRGKVDAIDLGRYWTKLGDSMIGVGDTLTDAFWNTARFVADDYRFNNPDDLREYIAKTVFDRQLKRRR